MYVTVKAAEGRRVWAGTAPLSNDIWQHVELTGDLVKAIRNGDVIEGTPEDGGGDGEPVVKVKESLDAAKQRAEEEAAARAEGSETGAAETGVPTQSETESPAETTPNP